MANQSGMVQSVGRAFMILELLTLGGGPMTLTQLTAESGMPAPTIHRLLRTLVELGYARQEPSRRYTLGPRVLLLANSASTMLSSVARPYLSALVDQLGESANLAMLDADEIVYIAQAPSRHSMRMFTEVGRRVLPHCTAVGKAVMADLPEPEIRARMSRTGMPRHTEHTITSPDEFIRALEFTRERGYALDNGEQELGVKCVAVAVPLTGATRLAISVSGPETRMTDNAIDKAVPALVEAGQALAAELE